MIAVAQFQRSYIIKDKSDSQYQPCINYFRRHFRSEIGRENGELEFFSPRIRGEFAAKGERRNSPPRTLFLDNR